MVGIGIEEVLREGERGEGAAGEGVEAFPVEGGGELEGEVVKGGGAGVADGEADVGGELGFGGSEVEIEIVGREGDGDAGGVVGGCVGGSLAGDFFRGFGVGGGDLICCWSCGEFEGVGGEVGGEVGGGVGVAGEEDFALGGGGGGLGFRGRGLDGWLLGVE